MDGMKVQHSGGMLHRLIGYELDTVISVLGLAGGLVIMSLYLISSTIHLLALGGALFLLPLCI